MRRSDEVRSVLQIAVVALALTACNTPAGNTDAGHTGTDSGGGDTGPAPAPMLPQAVANAAPAVYGCASTAPTPGAAIAITMSLEVFGQNGDKARNTHVCFCGNNLLSPEALAPTFGTSCGTGCESVMTDSTGAATVNGFANGWYAYRVFAQTGPTSSTMFLDSIQANEPAPAAAGGTVTGNAVSLLTAMLISEAELIPRVPGTTTIAGRMFDCGGNDVSNAIVRAYHADGTEIRQGVDPTEPHYAYFDGSENPDALATYTNTDGLYVGVNVTPVTATAGGSERIRVESWAFTGTGTGTATRIGCESVEAFADGVSIVNIGPLRSDYDAADPCHP